MDQNKAVKDLIRKKIEEYKNEELELLFSAQKSTQIKAFRGDIASFAVSDSSGVSARVIVDGKCGQSYTEQVDEESIDRCIAQAKENLTFMEEDKGNVLYDAVEELDSKKFLSEDLHRVTSEEKMNLALEIEKQALAFDSRVVNVPETMFADFYGAKIVANTKGIFKSTESSACYAYTYLMVQEGEETVLGDYIQIGKNFKDIDPKVICSKAVEEGIAKLNASEYDSGTYPVIFSNTAASSLLGAFINSPASPFNGENIEKGRSMLEGKLGTQIASDLVTIIDDPHQFNLSSSEFDSEGVPTSTTSLIDNGVFTEEIFNVYSAARQGKKSTGHGQRGYSSSLSTGLFNPYLTNGEMSEEELFKQLDNGVYITEVEGLHAGLNPISGDFSVAAKGFAVEGGNKGKAVKNITVAGNFFKVLKDISGKADNRRTNNYSSLSSPSILVKEMAISGK